jgi:hypothetical protein
MRGTIICGLLCFTVMGCNHQVENSPKADQQQIHKDEDSSKGLDHDIQQQIHKEETDNSIPPDTDSSQQSGCPNRADVSQSIQGYCNLLDQAQGILRDVRVAKSAQRAEVLQAQIPSWRKKEEEWRVQNSGLIARCDLLKSAQGIVVFPEIPLALEKLDVGSKCLEKAMDSAAQGHLDTSNACIRQARNAVSRARKVFDGKVKGNRRAPMEQPVERIPDP